MTQRVESLRWTLFLVLLAALIATAGYAWRLRRRLVAVEYDLHALSPIVKVSDGAFLVPPGPSNRQWRVYVVHSALCDEPNLPQKMKEHMERLQRRALEEP